VIISFIPAHCCFPNDQVKVSVSAMEGTVRDFYKYDLFLFVKLVPAGYIL